MPPVGAENVIRAGKQVMPLPFRGPLTCGRLGAAPTQRLKEDQIAAIVDGLGSLLAFLREADHASLDRSVHAGVDGSAAMGSRRRSARATSATPARDQDGGG